MQIATVVIPNLNGMKYLKDCLDSLRRQTRTDFSVILIDNGSTDGSADYVAQNYPGGAVERFSENRGFLRAVNAGIRMSSTRYVILLNNDTICDAQFVEQLVAAMEAHPDCFAGSSRMVQMADPSRMDNGGDFYCALGWAYTPAKGKPVERYERARAVFSACAGAAIYRRAVFDEIGMFDEAHFAYLEDVDVSWRARIYGLCNMYVPAAVVRHVGSATSGSVYNEFKVRHASRNSIYLIYKNMPVLQILWNLPFLIPGFLIKMLFFVKKGYGKEYITGLAKAGAEAATTFVSSFISGFNIGDLFGKAPSMMQAGLLGLGAIKTAGGIGSAVKTFGMLKTAILGTGSAATVAAPAVAAMGQGAVAAAGGVAKTTTLLGGVRLFFPRSPDGGGLPPLRLQRQLSV